MNIEVRTAAKEEKNQTGGRVSGGGVGATPRPQYRLLPLGLLLVSPLPLWRHLHGFPEAETPPVSWPD